MGIIISHDKGSWNLKHPFINGCFNWMIQNLYIGNGCFTKHPFKTGCLGFQVLINQTLELYKLHSLKLAASPASPCKNGGKGRKFPASFWGQTAGFQGLCCYGSFIYFRERRNDLG